MTVDYAERTVARIKRDLARPGLSAYQIRTWTAELEQAQDVIDRANRSR